MEKLIEFVIVLHKKDLHKDFVMRINPLKIEMYFDTYYFWSGDIETDIYNTLIQSVDDHLLKCRNSALGLSKKEFIYLPIDFSDQYFGAFKVTRLSDNKFEFNYGFVEKKMDTAYFENSQIVRLETGSAEFQSDFILYLSEVDIKQCFVLTIFSDS